MADRAAIIAKLKEILAADTEAKVDILDENSSIRESLGLDSIDLGSVVMRIEEAYRIRLTYQELEKVTLIKDLLDVIIAKINASSTPQTS